MRTQRSDFAALLLLALSSGPLLSQSGISNLRRLHALAIDVGEQDGLSRDVKIFDGILTDYGVPHVFETYPGDHTNHVADRVETKTMPFFSKNLSFEQPER